jgi:hypothetical protein
LVPSKLLIMRLIIRPSAVVDEGHRLKNMNCKLMKVIKKFKSAGRMLLTGTPLHVFDSLFNSSKDFIDVVTS